MWIMDRGLDGECRRQTPIDEHRVAEEARHHVSHARRVLQSAAIQSLVCQQQRQVTRAGRQAARRILAVADQQEARQTEIGLIGGALVRMRVIPVGAGAVVDGEPIGTAGTGGNGRVADLGFPARFRAKQPFRRPPWPIGDCPLSP
jgi:hypothetical protein